jgi:hypothetical protein
VGLETDGTECSVAMFSGSNIVGLNTTHTSTVGLRVLVEGNASSSATVRSCVFYYR